jgi:hypothetical protein
MLLASKIKDLLKIYKYESTTIIKSFTTIKHKKASKHISMFESYIH